MLSNRLTTRLRALLLLLVFASCDTITGPEGDLADAMARWQERGPADYSFVIQKSCECLPEVTQAREVVVRNRAVASVRYTSSMQPVDARYAADSPGVEGLFEIVDEAIEREAVRIDVTYDDHLGYPTRIEVDYSSPEVDDEVLYTISAFTPL